MKTLIVHIASILLFVSATALAQDDRMAELQERFKDRFPRLQQLKQAGQVGETDDGYVAAVKDAGGDVDRFIREENDDRRELYELIAKKENTTPDHVARRNAQRNFQRARSGEFLREAGRWRQKE